MLCDGDVFCFLCMFLDPNFSPTFTCRAACELNAPACPGGTTCEHRKSGLQGLCMP